ncbi:hypothetical protein ACFOGJ_16165 [Marinibaculum pumilum]|uniref:Uncharacterized protein n=1 Tax=Marinibaculum pumilum TaxID=1766165 RepID=A0ABV7L300_9PROT
MADLSSVEIIIPPLRLRPAAKVTARQRRENDDARAFAISGKHRLPSKEEDAAFRRKGAKWSAVAGLASLVLVMLWRAGVVSGDVAMSALVGFVALGMTSAAALAVIAAAQAIRRKRKRYG